MVEPAHGGDMSVMTAVPQRQQETPLMPVADGNIVLFHPHMPPKAPAMVAETLKTRWIGQGPKVALFEQQFSDMFTGGLPSLAVGEVHQHALAPRELVDLRVDVGDLPGLRKVGARHPQVRKLRE